MATIGWAPQPGPQHALVTCPVEEIFYGGARGGGKTDGMLGKAWIKAEIYGKAYKGIFFRKALPQLEAAIARANEIYAPPVATWRDSKKTFEFANGASLKFRYLERDQDAEEYQGHDYVDLFFEELTNWSDPKPIFKLKATLRSAAGVPCQMHGTGNPGGPGHHWVKARYIDPAPMGYEILTDEHGGKRVFIPSRVSDNAILLNNDPGYIGRLKQSGSESLVRAWLEGDWSVIEGAFFDCWSDKLIIKPFPIPDHWPRIVGFDWGSARPFAALWAAVCSEDYLHQGQTIKRGSLVFYREWYGASAPNVGLRMTAEPVGSGIAERTPERRDGKCPIDWVADPAIFSEDGGPSLAERMKLPFRRADNARVARNGHVGGWDQMRARMEAESIFFFDTCTESVRTIPLLQHDKTNAEDIDTDSEDHAADAVRYVCMARPFTRNAPKPREEIFRKPTLDELLAMQNKRKR
jgi:hypothetical protein